MKTLSYKLAAVVTTSALLGATDANATTGFQGITGTIRNSVSDIPQLLSVLSYLVGLGLAIAGVLKLKAHVDNPGNAPLKDGVIRLGAAGGLLALPSVVDAAIGTVTSGGTTGGAVMGTLDGLDF